MASANMAKIYDISRAKIYDAQNLTEDGDHSFVEEDHSNFFWNPTRRTLYTTTSGRKIFAGDLNGFPVPHFLELVQRAHERRPAPARPDLVLSGCKRAIEVLRSESALRVECSPFASMTESSPQGVAHITSHGLWRRTRT